MSFSYVFINMMYNLCFFLHLLPKMHNMYFLHVLIDKCAMSFHVAIDMVYNMCLFAYTYWCSVYCLLHVLNEVYFCMRINILYNVFFHIRINVFCMNLLIKYKCFACTSWYMYSVVFFASTYRYAVQCLSYMYFSIQCRMCFFACIYWYSV